ncbi:MAG: ACT domain-containing protein, partial [Chloroflexi bacterium]|nr:ACT domain-containing protein [Chloroflexota bacterium]
EHLDRPGLLGAVGSVTGAANVNISAMHVSRLKPRGVALMILALDERPSESDLKKIKSIPDIYTAKMVKL